MEPWIENYHLYAWIPGTALGCLAGCWGALVGICASRGKCKGLVYVLFGILIAACFVMLVAAVVAKAQGQPYGIWYGLGLPGLIGLLVLGANFPIVPRVYRQAELRKMESNDL